MHPLAEAVLAGDVRMTARACRLCDDRLPGYTELLRELYPHTGRAFVLGVTGNPGAGKSTVTNQLIGAYRARGHKVAVVAIDPSSPFSGGAILGDRIRMQRHFEDPSVFIRSVATRGALGGLSRSSLDVVRVLDAWGADVVIVETVGVGQDELEIVKAAHSVLVVMAPGLGDEIQAIKAGLLECADVFAVNKADRDGADATLRDLELMIALSGEVKSAGAHSRGHAAGHLDLAKQTVQHRGGAWVPRVTKCVAAKGEGVAEVVANLDAHRAWQATPDGLARAAVKQRELLQGSLKDAIIEAAAASLEREIERMSARVAARELDPYAAVEELLRAFKAS